MLFPKKIVTGKTMQEKNWVCVIVSVLCCCSLLMAGEHDEGVEGIIPEQFIGLWIEKGEDGENLGKITVSEQSIVWKQRGADTVIVKGEEITPFEDNKKLVFSSEVVVIQGKPIPAEKLEGKASIALLIDKDSLLIEISGVREKVQRCGAVPRKGCVGITREIVDGKMITCIKHSPEVHQYRKLK